MTYHLVAHFQVEYTVILPEYEHLVIGNFDILEQGNFPKYQGGHPLKEGLSAIALKTDQKVV